MQQGFKSDNIINSINKKDRDIFKNYVDAAYLWLKNPSNNITFPKDLKFTLDEMYDFIKSQHPNIW